MKLGSLFLCAAALLLPLRAAAAVPGKDAAPVQNIVVKPGDTFPSIADTYLKDAKKWNEVVKLNSLPPDAIAMPGMVLKVPVSLIKEQYRAAKLLFYVNEVILRKTGAADWGGVAAQMDLFKGDTLRTRAEARADVQFYTKEVLNLYPNSMVTLRPPGKDADVDLQAGSIFGRGAKVLTPSAKILPRTRDTEFDAKIKEDLTTQVQVRKGRVGVEAKGKTVEVPEGFATTVRFDMPPARPMKLPPMAEFAGGGGPKPGSGKVPQMKIAGGVLSLSQASPRAGTGGAAAPDINRNIETGNVNDTNINAAEIAKMISVANPVQSYHLQIAQGQNFAAPVLDKTYDAFDTINLSDLLPPGAYWMRVAYIDLLGFEGKFNAPRQITLGKKQ